jgi:hypothetical protein
MLQLQSQREELADVQDNPSGSKMRVALEALHPLPINWQRRSFFWHPNGRLAGRGTDDAKPVNTELQSRTLQA